MTFIFRRSFSPASRGRTKPEFEAPTPSPTLIGDFDLDESMGTTGTDDSATGNDGTYTNPTLGEGAIISGGTASVLFTGPTDPAHLTISHNAAYELDRWAFTGCAQINENLGAGSKHTIIQKDAPGVVGGFEYAVVTNSDGTMRHAGFVKNASAAAPDSVRFGGSSDGVQSVSVTAEVAFRWELSGHPDGTVELRINGSLIASISGAASLEANTEDIGLGIYLPTGASAALAHMGALKIYDDALDTDTRNGLAAVQNVTYTPPEEPEEPETPESPLDTHSPVIDATGLDIEPGDNPDQYRPGSASDARCHNLGLVDDNPSLFTHDNCGHEGPSLTYPVLIDPTPGGAVVGGRFVGLNPYTRDRDLVSYCNSAAILFNNGGDGGDPPTIFGPRINRTWDGVRITMGSANTVGNTSGTIKHAWITEAVDDAVDWPRMGNCRVEFCLIDRCYMGISVDPGGNYSGGDHGSETLEVFDNLIYIERELSISGLTSGGSSGGGSVLKPHGGGKSQKWDIRRTIWRCEHVSPAMANRLPAYFEGETKLVNSVDNHLLWTGPGSFANSGFSDIASSGWLAANGWTVLEGSTAVDFWETAKAEWIDDHPYVPRVSGDPPA